ncbi:aldo/keto reductase [Candidatus Latescibacterota bacterium]
MGTSNRRDFLKNVAIGGTAAGVGLTAAGFFPRRIYSEETSEFTRIVYRQLGSSGDKVTEIGFGAMNMRDPELVHAAIDKGINYIDTAHSYMRGENEEVIGSVMKTKRDKVFLTTKISSRNPENIPEMIETSLKRLQTDHVDLLLLHNVRSGEQILDDDILKFFDDARRKGHTRFVGFSAHDFQDELLDATLESKFWEAVLVVYNYLSPQGVTESIKKAREAGIGIIGMKNLITAGRPRKPIPDIRKDKTSKTTPQQALLKWVLDNDYVDTIIPGMTSFEQLDDDLAVMGMKLTYDDHRILRRYVENTKGQYCCGVAGCTGCKGGCPKGMEINEINRCLNYAYGYNNIELAYENYRELPRSNRIDICNDCDECVVKCVNGLNLTENILKARKLFA